MDHLALNLTCKGEAGRAGPGRAGPLDLNLEPRTRAADISASGNLRGSRLGGTFSHNEASEEVGRRGEGGRGEKNELCHSVNPLKMPMCN